MNITDTGVISANIGLIGTIHYYESKKTHSWTITERIPLLKASPAFNNEFDDIIQIFAKKTQTILVINRQNV